MGEQEVFQEFIPVANVLVACVLHLLFGVFIGVYVTVKVISKKLTDDE